MLNFHSKYIYTASQVSFATFRAKCVLRAMLPPQVAKRRRDLRRPNSRQIYCHFTHTRATFFFLPRIYGFPICAILKMKEILCSFINGIYDTFRAVDQAEQTAESVGEEDNLRVTLLQLHII